MDCAPFVLVRIRDITQVQVVEGLGLACIQPAQHVSPGQLLGRRCQAYAGCQASAAWELPGLMAQQPHHLACHSHQKGHACHQL